MTDKKKTLNAIGKILTLISIIFIIQKLRDLEWDFSFFNNTSLFVFCFLILLQACLIFSMSFPWKIFVEILSGEKIPFLPVLKVYTEANIMKYIPGNIFQYVGRNALINNAPITASCVATSVLFDLMATLCASVLIVLCFWGKYAFIQLKKYIHMFAVLAVIVIILGAVIWCFRKKIKSAINISNISQSILKKGNRNKIILLVCYDFIMLLTSDMVYVIVFYITTNLNFELGLTMQLIGSFTFAWLIGFITPGAPGGIGVRESIMILVAGNMAGYDAITLSIVIYRGITTIADVVSFLIVKVMTFKKKGWI